MSGFALMRPEGPLYRVARAPDAWAWPDWSYAGADGTFGNRFDDPAGSYRVLYASSTRLGALIETLARFRVDLSVIAGMREIEGPEAAASWGVLPRQWLAGRIVGEAIVDAAFVDVGAAESLGTIRTQLAASAIRHGFDDIDAAAVRSRAPRRFTQEVSRLVYEWREQEGGCAGICYRSRLGDQFVNWAIFEPASDDDAGLSMRSECGIAPDDPDLTRALELLNLRIG
jgi:hypothetical protein